MPSSQDFFLNKNVFGLVSRLYMDQGPYSDFRDRDRIPIFKPQTGCRIFFMTKNSFFSGNKKIIEYQENIIKFTHRKYIGWKLLVCVVGKVVGGRRVRG